MTQGRQYWAWRGKRMVGPCDSREDALTLFRAKYPFSGADYEAKAPRNLICTGYGSDKPMFDLRWDSAK